MSASEDEALDVSTEEGTSTDTAVAEAEEEEFRLSLDVGITDSGPCKKHVSVTVPRSDIDHILDEVVNEMGESADVPGFRAGHVPKKLLKKRFKKELGNEVKQKILMGSLEQISEDNKLDPINEPNLDVENIEIPDEGDFEFEFDVEVRPDFELPDYSKLKITRPVRDITEESVDSYLGEFLSQYGKHEIVDGAAEKGDFVTVMVEFTHDGKPLREIDEMTAQLKSTLRFQDAEIPGFDELMAGAKAGDLRETDIAVSQEAETLEMRGETVHAKLNVKEVRRLDLPEINKEFLEKIGVETEEELRLEINNILERQVTYEQRQSTRSQVLDKITESADWKLPEDLVMKQVENALHREILEMQQAGFTTQEIQARENELRQQSVTTTRQALKEHFVLDKIAEKENIDVLPADIEKEIQMMAMQRGESPRRLRARLTKSGVIENLEAQIRERKAVDAILDSAEFEDVEMKQSTDADVEAVNQSVCRTISSIATGVDDDEETEGDDADE